MIPGRCRSERRAATLRRATVAALAVALLGGAGCTGAARPSGVIGQPPTPGSITETVPAVTPPAAKRYGLAEEAEVAGLRVRIESVSAREVDSTIPGEGSGSALVFALQLRNDTSAAYRTELLETALTDSSGGSTTRITGAPARPFPAVLEPGAEATAAYVYLVGTDKRRPVTFTVSVGGGRQPAEFRGDA